MSTSNELVFSAERPSYYSNRVLRLAIKSALAQTSGTDCLALLTVVVMTEDARRYRGPVTFWNSQLLPLLGFSKWERLDKARRAAIDAGWLAYEPGGRHRAGSYRVTIPYELQDIEDTAVDEGSIPSRSPNREADTGIKADTNTGINRESSRISTGGSSLPVPEPKPKRNVADAVLSVKLLNDLTELWRKSPLRQFRSLTGKRRTSLRQRLADPDWKASWREALQRASESSFCSGQNDRGWEADIDWFLKPDTVTQLLEGKFADAKGRKGESTQDVPQERLTAEQKKYQEDRANAAQE